MNIFKILGSGDSKIKEPNVSAFLGYLLNPNEDHGLKDVFLKKILEPFLNIDASPIKTFLSNQYENDDDFYILDLGVNTHFNVEVVLEKAFTKEARKQIVDILIKITQKEKKSKEDVSYLFSKNEKPIAIILLENKIKEKSYDIEQLKRQYNSSVDFLPKEVIPTDEWEQWKDNICTVLITPYISSLKNDFTSFQNTNKNSIYHTWKDSQIQQDDPTSISIKKLLNDILIESDNGEISPIPSYTLDTLRGLIEFIEDDFSSDVDDQRIGNKPKRFKKYDLLEDSIQHGDGGFSKMSDQMRKFITSINNEIIKKESLAPVYTQSRISVKYNGRNIWNIQFVNNKEVRIEYFNTKIFEQSTDECVEGTKRSFYRRNHIVISEDDLKSIVQNLDFAMKNQKIS